MADLKLISILYLVVFLAVIIIAFGELTKQVTVQTNDLVFLLLHELWVGHQFGLKLFNLLFDKVDVLVSPFKAYFLFSLQLNDLSDVDEELGFQHFYFEICLQEVLEL